MKKLITILVVLAVAFSGINAYAAKSGKGASAMAMEKSGDDAVFHRVGDWFATVGKSDEEKQAVLAERKAKRAAKRAQKQARKKEKEMKEKMRKAKDDMKKKMGK